jgi:hypothetical protein
MNAPRKYVTRSEAADIAGVSERTINRWAARQLLWTYRRKGPYGPAEYDQEEVLRVVWGDTTTLTLPDEDATPETDIST